MLKYQFSTHTHTAHSVSSILSIEKKGEDFFVHSVAVYILFDFFFSPNFKPEEIYICFTFSNDGLTDETILFSHSKRKFYSVCTKKHTKRTNKKNPTRQHLNMGSYTNRCKTKACTRATKKEEEEL